MKHSHLHRVVKLNICFFILLLSCQARSRDNEGESVHTSRHFPDKSDLPPGWELAPGSLEGFPIISVAAHPVTAIDPWSYLQRLGLYKTMLNFTEPYFRAWGYNNTGNILWGLPLQFGWQYSTGRLQDKQDKLQFNDLHFTPQRWWGSMNYFLSVIPFLACMRTGVITDVPYPVYVRKPQNDTGDHFCTSVDECSQKHPQLMAKWEYFFTQIQKMKYSDLTPDINTLQDEIIGYLWEGHTTSIHVALPLFNPQLDYLSKPEKNFGLDWANIVVVIAEMHFETNINQTLEQQRLLLPPRILKPGDRAPFIPDFTKPQNKALLALHLIRKTNEETHGLVLKLWHKAMCSPQGRADGRNLMKNMILHPEIIPKDLLKLLVDYIKNHKC